MLTPEPNQLQTPAEIEALYTKLVAYVKDELIPLSENQLRWQPEAGRWSIAECAAHLVEAHAPYLKLLDERLAQLPPRRSEFQSGFWGRKLYSFTRVRPDGQVSRRVKAPHTISPSQDAQTRPHWVMGHLLEQLEHFRQLTQQSANRDWNGTPIPTTLIPLIRLRWGDVLRFLGAHNERHLLQAQRVRQAPGFPVN